MRQIWGTKRKRKDTDTIDNPPLKQRCFNVRDVKQETIDTKIDSKTKVHKTVRWADECKVNVNNGPTVHKTYPYKSCLKSSPNQFHTP